MAESRTLPSAEKPIPFPPVVDDSSLRAVEESQVAEKSQVDRANFSHRRMISGNILSKLPFLRSNSNSDKSSLDGTNEEEDLSLYEGSPTSGQESGKARKRNRSLRKTALLGKGVLGRDRKVGDARLKSPLSSPQSPRENEKTLSTSTVEADLDVNPRPSNDEDSPVLSVAPPKWTHPTTKASMSSLRSSAPSIELASSKASIASAVLPIDHSTTDDDDQVLSFPQLPFVGTRKSASTSGDSYFPPQHSFHSRRPTNRTKSPLATQPQSLTASPVPSEEEWDYSETAYWGYVILIITWLVFVVGLGSCFDVWSWAWDVGETPYAPPELNDDPTLPIVGYYPALMVLTSVMAWVWVVVAWVGMKYFRHAEGRGDDS